jgi:acyl-CoA reductase-like NAD-dependent aldehyde dehydrogenase
MNAPIKTYFASICQHGYGPLYNTHYPADGSKAAVLHACTKKHVDVAVNDADNARKQPTRANSKPYEQAFLLYKIDQGLRDIGWVN